MTLPGQPTPPGSGGGSGGITIPSATTSGNFDSAALAGFRVERARVSIEGEFLWAGMSDSVETPHFTLTVETISFRIMGGVDVAPALYIDAGVRRFALNMTASILDFQPVTWKPGIWEPVVGVTFRPQLPASCASLPGRTSAGAATSRAEAARQRRASSGSHPPVARRRLGLEGSQGRRHSADTRRRAPVADAERPSADARHSVLRRPMPSSVGVTVAHPSSSRLVPNVFCRADRLRRGPLLALACAVHSCPSPRWSTTTTASSSRTRRP